MFYLVIADLPTLLQTDYGDDREACFGFVSPPQIEKNEYQYLEIPYNKIVFIFKLRYYLKVSALEIYTIDKQYYSNSSIIK